MSTVVYRYAEDPTGTNPDNYVTAELHELSEKPVRVIVPTYGLFYTESLRLYDQVTMRPLVHMQDYRVPIINQEASLKFGKEIGDAILIENIEVSNKVLISYQVLGGVYQNNISTITSIFETWLNDNRGVDWLTGVFGKPNEYPPAPHPHWMTDLFGFETFNFMLERIVQAIMMGNTGAFDDLILAIERRIVSEPEIDVAEPVKRVVSLQRLLYALDKLNYNSMTLTPESYDLRRGRDLWFDLKVTNMPEDPQLYWTIEHGTTENGDFSWESGVVILNRGVARFKIHSERTLGQVPGRTFRLNIRKNGAQGHVLARSYPIHLKGRGGVGESPMLRAMTHGCICDPRTGRNAPIHYAAKSYGGMILS